MVGSILGESRGLPGGSMITCERCQRHYRAAEDGCPFCARPAGPGVVRKTLNFVGGAMTTVVLAACYGTGGFVDDIPIDTGDTSGDTGDSGETGDTSTSADLDGENAHPGGAT